MTEPARLAPPFDLVGADLYDADRAPVQAARCAAGASRARRQRRRPIWRSPRAMAAILGAGGWTLVDVVLFVCFLVAAPWTVLGFWNAVDRALAAARPGGRRRRRSRPSPRAGDAREPIRAAHRDPDDACATRTRRRAFARLADGEGAASTRPARATRFAYFVLSDTSDPAVAAAEEAAVAAWRARRRRSGAHRLSPPRRQHRLQGRQRARLLRDAGARLRPDAAARRRQPDVGRGDPAPGAHHAGASEARHPAEPRRRRAGDERLRAHLPVRHAPRHARLHDGLGLVDRRLRPVLGPQRARAHRALPRALPSAGPAGQAAARRPRAVARPGRGDADAPGRLRGARAAGGERQLGGEPADPVRILDPRPALVPGQHAVSEAARPAGPPADEPLPARLGDPDVRRRAGHDADDRARAAEGPRRRGPADLSGRARDRALSDLPRHVSVAEARRARRHPPDDGRRRALWRRGAFPRRRGDRDRVLVPARRRRRPSASRCS